MQSADDYHVSTLREKPASRLGLVGGALLCWVVLLQIPTVMLQASHQDLHAEPFDIAGLLLALFLASTALIVLSLRCAPRNARATLASIVFSIAVYAWVRASFFAGPALSLNGVDSLVENQTGFLGILGPVLSGIAAFRMSRRMEPLAFRFGAVLLAGIVMQTLIMLLPLGSMDNRAHSSSSVSPITMSSTSNVLVILLDALQSDVFDEVLNRRPEIADGLAGFHYFPDANSDSPTTFLSLPAIHSGMHYEEGVSAYDFFVNAITKNSFLSRLADEGFSATYLRSVGDCPRGPVSCISASELQFGRWRTAAIEARQLASIGLYRIMPDKLRNLMAIVWRTGAFTSPVNQKIIAGVDVLQRLSGQLEVVPDRSTVIFVHSLATHAPFIMNSDCAIKTESTDREGAVEQGICALSTVARLLREMDRRGVYDDSLVVIAADHGYGFPSKFARADSDAEFRSFVGGFNPVMLVKPRNERAPLQRSTAAVRVADLANALCDANGCDIDEVIDRLVALGSAHPRQIQNYHWKNEYWQEADIPGKQAYRLDGSLFEACNWWGSGAPYAIGSTLGFGVDGNSAGYVGFGWSSPEPGYTWSNGKQATLFLQAKFAADTRYELTLDSLIYGAAAQSERRVGVRVNGTKVGELRSDSAAWVFHSDSLGIPAGLLRAEDMNQICFDIVDPLDPPGPDARKLGIAIRSLRLDVEQGLVVPASGHERHP